MGKQIAVTMLITVRLCNGFATALTYSVPQEFSHEIKPGRIVRVPLKQRIERALVQTITTEPLVTSYQIRPILSLEPISNDPLHYTFLEQLAAYYALDPFVLHSRIYQPESTKTSQPEDIVSIAEEQSSQKWILTPEQEDIVAQERQFLQNSAFHPTLLHGVTGSGKTAVYCALLREAYHLSKTALLLLPEVSLARACAQLLRTQLPPEYTLHEYHSATTVRQKRALWNDILASKPFILLGVHLPILLPLPHLGLIIVDEEHDPGYQEKKHPHINTKEAALLRARHYHIPIMLGSATPSINSWHIAHSKAWPIYRLTQRFAGAFPTITHVRIKKEQQKNGSPDLFWISKTLRIALEEQLKKGEQAIVFLNRRGIHKFVQCPTCAHIFSCSACSVSLTLHADHQLICHYCGIQQHIPHCCPTCNTKQAEFVKQGIGTQRIVALLQELFPHARIARADTDSRKQKSWQDIITRMQQQQIDILVGTQTITKGYHFPHVTLVGVVWAESNLSLPFYTAPETTLQQLLQVAGRAGRATQQSRVIIQSYIAHPVFKYMNETHYERFYQYEIEHRRELHYPPYVRLSEIEFQSSHEAQLDHETNLIVDSLRALITRHKWEVTLLGPALPPVHKIKHRSIRKLYLKSTSINTHITLFHATQKWLRERASKTSAFFTPNPVQ